MKLTRLNARNLFFNLGQVALKEMDAEVLEDVMANFETLRKVNDGYDNLAKELAKRLYGDPETMGEETRKNYADFMEIISKFERSRETEDRKELLGVAQSAYPGLFKLYEKHIAVLNGLLNKEIDIDIKTVNKAKFAAGIIKGNEGWSAFKVDYTFGAMYEEETKQEDDFSELDELLKD